MKTLDQWEEEFRRRGEDWINLRYLIQAVRREAFERCELEAYRADSETSENTGLSAPTGWGRHVAERIAKVLKEEGAK